MLNQDIYIEYQGKIKSPLAISMSSVKKADRSAVAESCLCALVNRCKQDIEKGDEFLDEGFEEPGKKQIVFDYLLWSKRFQSHVPSGYYLARVEELNGLIC